MLVKFMRGLYVSAAAVMEMAVIGTNTIVLKTRDGQFHSITVDEDKDPYELLDELASQVNWARMS